MRVGYALGDPGVLKQLAEAQSTFAVSVIAQAGALAALDDHDHVQQALESNGRGMKFLLDGLFRLGFSPVPSWANFVYCDVRQDAAAFAARMEERGVLIRSLAPWGAATAVRVTVGSAEHNQTFLQACEKVLEP